jgi:hypothetical protein
LGQQRFKLGKPLHGRSQHAQRRRDVTVLAPSNDSMLLWNAQSFS